MCEFHESTCNGFGDIWWTDTPIYFGSIDMQYTIAPIDFIIIWKGKRSKSQVAKKKPARGRHNTKQQWEPKCRHSYIPLSNYPRLRRVSLSVCMSACVTNKLLLRLILFFTQEVLRLSLDPLPRWSGFFTKICHQSMPRRQTCVMMSHVRIILS